VRQNARTHGIFSDVAVIPGQESEEEWRIHLEGINESYKPEGYLESQLAARIAAILWRLRRIARFERDALALAVEGLSVESGPTILQDTILSDSRAVAVKRLLPEPSVLDRVMRYEAHLHKQLMQTMHELEAMQARRHGAMTPLARLDVTESSLADTV
jgi:hypothetical protein